MMERIDKACGVLAAPTQTPVGRNRPGETDPALKPMKWRVQKSSAALSQAALDRVTQVLQVMMSRNFPTLKDYQQTRPATRAYDNRVLLLSRHQSEHRCHQCRQVVLGQVHLEMTITELKPAQYPC